MFAAFKDSGHGQYTIIVYNNLERPAQYTLSAYGGTLIDDAGQTAISASDAQVQTISSDAGGAASNATVLATA